MKKFRVPVWINRTTSYDVVVEVEDDETIVEAKEQALDIVGEGGDNVTEGDTDTMDSGCYDGTEELTP